MNFSPKKPVAPEINMMPLIDVVLQLVIFFMLTTQFVTLPGITINLPSVAPGSQATAMERLEVVVADSGDLYVDGLVVPQGGLAGALARTAQDPETAVVLLSADRKTTHGRIVDIMDALRRHGFKRIVWAARETPES